MDTPSLFLMEEKQEEGNCVKTEKTLAAKIVQRCGSHLNLQMERKFIRLPRKVGMADGFFQKRLGMKEQN